MDIQWGQIVTQIIGFLLALWLLKRYAWDRLLEFIEKRRETIASSFEEIERTRAEAEKQKEKYEKELENIETLKRAKIQEAAQEANKLASDIKEEARRESVAMRLRASEDIERELDKANATLRDRIVDAVIAATEKVIKERLDQKKQAKLIDEFLDEVKLGK